MFLILTEPNVVNSFKTEDNQILSKFPKEKEILLSYFNNFKNDIISGSIALSLLGLINRTVSDIDILIKNKNRYSGYINNTYSDDEELDNRLGYINFEYKKNFFSKTRDYEVDFFLNLL